MNDKLYEKLKEHCDYDLKEVENTIQYFRNRLAQEPHYESKNNLELMLIDEINCVLECNYDNYETGIDLTESEKLEISRDIIDSEYQFWEDLNAIIINIINNKLKTKLEYLRNKNKLSNLDKEEKHQLEILTNWENEF
jgi:hypothetical protein